MADIELQVEPPKKQKRGSEPAINEEEVFTVEDEGFTQKPEVEEEDEAFQKRGVFFFNEPIMIDGEEVKSVRYDFTRLKPMDVIRIVQAVGKKENVVVPSLNLTVQANVFFKAVSIPPAVGKTQMAVEDFMQACSLARDFLLSGKAAKPEEDLI